MSIPILPNQIVIENIRKTQARNYRRLEAEFERISSVIIERIQQIRKLFTLLALQHTKIKGRKAQVFKVAFFPIIAQTCLKTAPNKVRVSAQKIAVGVIVPQTYNAAGRLSIKISHNSAGK